jgi:hypothetical protein
MSHARKTVRGKRTGGNYRREIAKPHGPYKPHKSYTPEQVGFYSPKENRAGVFAITCGLGLAVAVVLGLALMVFIGHGGPSSGSVVYGSLNHPKGPCGNAGQAPCAAVDPGWFPVTSPSPTVVGAAIANSRNFASMQGQFGYVGLDVPALVHAYGAHTGSSYYDDDHWVVSVRDASGMRCGIFDFVYDRAHQRMRFSSYGVITSLDPHARMAFPYTPSPVAVTKLEDQRRLSLKTGTQPELIFFPIDPNFPGLTSPLHKWTGGGNSALNPMWRIVGSDGQDYFVGADLNVHGQKDLPIAIGQP